MVLGCAITVNVMAQPTPAAHARPATRQTFTSLGFPSPGGDWQSRDTLKRRVLDSVTITSFLSQPTISRLDNIHGSYNLTGKKTEVINLICTDADVTNKTGRQIFAKIPGVFVYD